LLNSCIDESDWAKLVIPANQKLVFSEPEEFMEIKYLIIPVGDSDTLFIKNLNLVNRVCYIRAAYPEKDITIDYVKIEEDGKEVLDARFIKIQ
jgi:hypothetical protein